jgi:hypothetical protein
MKLENKKNKYIVTASSSDKFSDFLAFLSKHDVPHFPEEVIVKNNSIPVKRIEDLLIAIHQIKSFRTNTESYFPTDVGDSSNFSVSYEDWMEVPCFQKYVNHRIRIISDPEFLLIQWSKAFESFDINNNALMPSYPKSLTNILFTPQEVKDVCRLIIFEWTVNGRRNKEIPLSHKDAHKQFKESFPLLYNLVFTEDGFLILRTVYEIILLTDNDPNQSKETRKKCLDLFTTMVTGIKDKTLRAYMSKNDKIGVNFVGMPNARIYGPCILSIYFSFDFFYFPNENIYHLDKTTSDYMERLKKKYHEKYPTGIFEVDYDFKKKKDITKPISFDFYLKERVIKINLIFNKPGYSTFFNSLTPVLLCMSNSNQIIG